MNLGAETEQVEHKKSTSELKEGMQSIAAILNKHSAGELYFGVRDNGEVIGQQTGARTLRDVSQAITTSIEPRVYATVEKLQADDDKTYIKVTFSGNERPYSCRGTYRIRVADEDLAMSTAQLESLMLERLNRREPWDARASLRPISNVDEKTLKDYIERGNTNGRISFEYDGVEPVLERMGLLTADGRLTNAAAVLFCKSRVAALKMGVFANEKRIDILDIQQASGTLFDLLNQARFYVLSNIRRRVKITGEKMERDEIPELPMDAVREAIVNALAHQDYTAGEAIQVEIYPSSVEIYNAGWFIDGQVPEDHLSGKSHNSKSRNELIANTLFKSKDIEHFGTGMLRLQELCDEAGVKVEYLNCDNGTRVVFHRNDPFAGSTSSEEFASSSQAVRKQFANDNENAAYAYLVANGPTGPAAIADVLGMTRRGAQKLLQRLVEREYLEARGTTSNRVYYVSNKR